MASRFSLVRILLYRVCFYFIRFPSHSGPLLPAPSRPLLSAFVCERNLMTVYKRPESLRQVSAVVVVEGCEGSNWRATGMGRWGAIGRRRRHRLCASVHAKPETARTVTPTRREKKVFQIRARASGEGLPEGMASSAQATKRTCRCIRSGVGWR